MFHDVHKITQQFLKDLEEQRPDLLPFAGTLGAHFHEKYADYRYKKHIDAKIDTTLHVIFTVLTETTLDSAIQNIAQTRKIRADSVGAIICDALSDALPHIVPYAAALRDKGLYHVRDRFFLAGKGFEKGGALDMLSRLAAEKYPQATEEALYRSFSNRRVATSHANPFGRATLPYILLRLATAGDPGCSFQENSLTLGVSEKAVQENTARIAPAIRTLELEYGLSIPGIKAENQAHTPEIKNHVPVYAPGADVNTIPAHRHGTQVVDSPGTLEKQQLVHVLKDIITSRAYGINMQDGQVYLAYMRIPKKVADPALRLTARFNLSREKIEDAYNRVAAAVAAHIQSHADGMKGQTSTSISRAPSVQSSAARTVRSE